MAALIIMQSVRVGAQLGEVRDRGEIGYRFITRDFLGSVGAVWLLNASGAVSEGGATDLVRAVTLSWLANAVYWLSSRLCGIDPGRAEAYGASALFAGIAFLV